GLTWVKRGRGRVVLAVEHAVAGRANDRRQADDGRNLALAAPNSGIAAFEAVAFANHERVAGAVRDVRNLDFGIRGKNAVRAAIAAAARVIGLGDGGGLRQDARKLAIVVQAGAKGAARVGGTNEDGELQLQLR